MTYLTFVPQGSSSSSNSSDTTTTARFNDQVLQRLKQLGVPPDLVQLPQFELIDLFAAGLYHADGTAPTSDQVYNTLYTYEVYDCSVTSSTQSLL
jgi:hypothetical protein